MQTNVPQGQTNARLHKDFIMRVGVPHGGGRLASYAYKCDYPIMVSAAAFFDRKKQKFPEASCSSLWDTDFALDSAGFSAVSTWGRQGKQRGMAGIYPWTLEEYLAFAVGSGARWYSQPDLCTEQEVAKDREEVVYRIQATATLLESLLRTVYAWQNELARTGSPSEVVEDMVRPCVPVIQGRTIDDYKLSMELMLRIWSQFEPWLAPPALIGIGSMCRRDVLDPEQGLLAILDGIKEYIPEGSKLHVFGAKGTALPHLAQMDFVQGSDSMAWDFSTRMSACKAGVSNTMERRKAGMTEWMEAAFARINPTVAHQFKLRAA